jgi:transposase
MSGIRRTFSREFKVSAVQRVLEEGRSIRSVAFDLSIGKSTLGRWVMAYREDPNHCFPGSGKQKPEAGELSHLRRQVRDLEAEVDFLKKARDFFAKDRT